MQQKCFQYQQFLQGQAQIPHRGFQDFQVCDLSILRQLFRQQFLKEALFYLKSRGIGDRAARALLVQAFIGDVLEGFGQDEVAQEVEGLLAERHGWM